MPESLPYPQARPSLRGRGMQSRLGPLAFVLLVAGQPGNVAPQSSKLPIETPRFHLSGDERFMLTLERPARACIYLIARDQRAY